MEIRRETGRERERERERERKRERESGPRPDYVTVCYSRRGSFVPVGGKPSVLLSSIPHH